MRGSVADRPKGEVAPRRIRRQGAYPIRTGGENALHIVERQGHGQLRYVEQRFDSHIEATRLQRLSQRHGIDLRPGDQRAHRPRQPLKAKNAGLQRFSNSAPAS